MGSLREESYFERQKRKDLIIHDFLERFYVEDIPTLKCFGAIYINVLKMTKVGLEDEQEFLNEIFEQILDASRYTVDKWLKLKPEGKNDFPYSEALEIQHYTDDIKEIKERRSKGRLQRGPVYYFVLHSFEGALLSLYNNMDRHEPQECYYFQRVFTFENDYYVVLKEKQKPNNCYYYQYIIDRGYERLSQVCDPVLKRVLDMF